MSHSFQSNIFSFQYLSDIGGTAGLVLGLSIASVLKHMETFYFNKRDWLKEKISKRVKGWQYRNELSSKENFLFGFGVVMVW